MQILSSYEQADSWTASNRSNDSLLSLLNDTNTDVLLRPVISTIFISICLSIIILLTIIGNILVLLALCIDFALRSPTHLLMGNLACADLLLGITVLPFSATLEILEGQWLFGKAFCHIWLVIDVLYCTSSIYGLMFISIERYIGVTRPLRYPLIVTHRRTMLAILLAWLVAIIVSIVPLLGWNNEVKSTDRKCVVNDNLSYVLFSCSFSFYIPLIIILCVYGRIYSEALRQYKFLNGGEKRVRLNETIGHECVTLRIHLPQHLLTSTTSLSNGNTSNSTTTTANAPTTTLIPHNKRISAQIPTFGTSKLSKFRRERKAAKTLGIVVGMFILCWLPFFALLPIKSLTNSDPGIIFSICFWLGYCNSCFNPFIYAFSSREFRKSFLSILKCHRKKYRTSTSFYRISVTTPTEQIRLEKSHSCDITPHTLKMSASTANYQTPFSHHRNLLSSSTNRNPSAFRPISNDRMSKSLIAINEKSSWHFQKTLNVR